MEDRELPIGPMGYAIDRENHEHLEATGVDTRFMLKMAELAKPEFNPVVHPMTLFDPLNQGGQGACFPAGTPVTMHDGTLKPIEDVRFGESVLTHCGRARQVTDTMSRLFTGDMYEVFVKGWGKFKLTEEHPVRVMRDERLQWVRADQLVETDLVVLSNGPAEVRKQFIDLADYVSDLNEDGGRVSVMHTSDWTDRYLALDSLTCYVLGLYVAEGSTDKTSSGLPNRSTFTMHKDEHFEHSEIERFALRFGAGFTKQQSQSKAVNLRLASCILARFLEVVCGRFCNKKQVPTFILTGSHEQKLAFLRGYYAGDGSRAKYDSGRLARSGNAVRCNQLHSATASITLSQQVSTMLVSLGMKPGRTVTRSRSHQRFDSHQVYLYSKDAADFLEQEFVSIRSPRSTRYCSEGQLRAIRAIDREPVRNVPVYDITVDEDHSFVANGLVVHNCQGHALAMMFMICYFLATGRVLHFSRAAGYYLSQRKDGIRGDRGSTLSGGQWVATQHGMCLEKDWKYPANYDASEPAGVAYPFRLVASKPTRDPAEVQAWLDLGLPVQDGIIWDNSVSRTISTDFTGRGGGGHSTALWTKSTDGNYRRINSWGMWDGDGCNENTPQSLSKQVKHSFSTHILYGPAEMIYPELKPVEV